MATEITPLKGTEQKASEKQFLEQQNPQQPQQTQQPQQPQQSQQSLQSQPQPFVSRYQELAPKNNPIFETYKRNVKNGRICVTFFDQIPLREDELEIARKTHFQYPQHVFHNESLPNRTPSESIIWATLIEPLLWPQLLRPTRVFLIYGNDASGKSSLVSAMYKAIENTQDLCGYTIHLLFNCKLWRDSVTKTGDIAENRIQQHWELALATLRSCAAINTSCYIIAEFENFQEVCGPLHLNEENDPIGDVFRRLSPRVIFVASTSKPNMCKPLFVKHASQVAAVRVSPPSKEFMKDVLLTHILKIFGISAGSLILSESPENQETMKRLDKFLQLQIEKHNLEKVSLSEMFHIVLPRIEANSARARLFWFNPVSQCVLNPVKGCSEEDKGRTSLETPTACTILEKTEPLTTEDIKTLNPKIRCDQLAKQCENSGEGVRLSGDFLDKGWDLLQQIMSEVFATAKKTETSELDGEYETFSLK